jgi:hypothetical protein
MSCVAINAAHAVARRHEVYMRTSLLRVLLVISMYAFITAAFVVPPALQAQPITEAFRPAPLQTSPFPMAEPEFIGSVGGYVAPVEVAVVDGMTAYVGEGAELVVVDVHDPALPAEQARLTLPAPVRDVHVNNGTAYVATQNGLLVIVDVRAATAPVLLGTYRSAPVPGETSRDATSVYVVGTMAYLTYAIDRDGTYMADFQIVDVRTPQAPVLRSRTTPGPKIARDVVVQNNLAYVLFASASAGGLVIYDVSKPAAPVLRSTFAMQPPQSIFVAGNRAYVTVYADGINDGGLTVVDVSTAAQPRQLGHFVGDFAAVSVHNTLAYVVGQAGIQVLDVGDPAAITPRGSIATSGAATRVFVDVTHAFVAAQGGLHVIDVMMPDHLRLCNQRIARRVLNARASGTTAYLYDVTGEPAVQVVDLRTATQPVLRGRLPVSFVIEDMDVAGTMLYLAAGADGVQIIDVSDPNVPVLRGHFDTPAYAYAVQVHNNIAYVADGESGLQIVNVAKLAQPQLLGALDTAGVSISLDVLNNNVYLGNTAYADAPATDAGVQIIDVARPQAPQVRGTYTGLHAQSIEVMNDTAYVAAGTSGLVMLDVHDPAHPTERGTTTAIVALDVKIAGSLAYVATGGDGIRIVDVIDPTQLMLNGTLAIPGYAQSIDAAGDLVLVAADEGGLGLWRVRAPAPQFTTFVPLAR